MEWKRKAVFGWQQRAGDKRSEAARPWDVVRSHPRAAAALTPTYGDALRADLLRLGLAGDRPANRYDPRGRKLPAERPFLKAIIRY
jgi:hypothetical protein